MEHRRLRKSAIYLLYSLGFVLLVGIAYLIDGAFNNKTLDDDTRYVNETIVDDETKPVVADEKKIIRPYKDENVKIVKDYYDYKADENAQMNSIIVYDKTYLQSTGVSYSNGAEFDVIAVLDGKVKSVKEDENLGMVVQLEHENNIISVYHSLKDLTIKEGDTISQGDIIGKSGTNNLEKDLGNHLYFEFIVNGINVDPEDYYDKTINELRG